jgi:hypothetical protein
MQYKPQLVVEVGMAYGISTLAILTGLRDLKANGKLISIDPGQSVHFHDVGQTNVQRAGYADNHILFEKYDYLALPQLIQENTKVDFAYIDGWHTFDYTLLDFFLLDKMLCVNGIVGFNDCALPAVRKVLGFVKTHRKYRKIDVGLNPNYITRKMNRYLYGDKLLKKAYVMADDKHAFTEGKNLEVIDKKLRILTRREKAKGLVWNPAMGFYEKEFDFSSDMISSANGFSQAFGMIEAKVKFGKSDVAQAFSLMTEQILPHINIVKFEKGKIASGNYWKNSSQVSKSISSAGGGKYTNDFHIFTIIWESGKLTWKVNGVEFKVQTEGVPDSPLFMVFNSSLKTNASDSGIPSAFEIDWVRAYKAK